MATSFEDALTAQLVSGMNPMTGVMKQLAVQQVENGRETLNDSKISTMLRLEEIINNGTKNGSDPKVIAAFQRMLDSYA